MKFVGIHKTQETEEVQAQNFFKQKPTENFILLDQNQSQNVESPPKKSSLSLS